MTQAHLDTRTFRKAEGPIITASWPATDVRARAVRECLHGRLVYVCAWCVSDAVKDAIADLENISHGVCTACLNAEIGGPR